MRRREFPIARTHQKLCDFSGLLKSHSTIGSSPINSCNLNSGSNKSGRGKEPTE
jgi:hypothetical protein